MARAAETADRTEPDHKQQSWQLLCQYQRSPNLATRNRLVDLNYGLVKKEAHHWRQQCREPYEDLLQVGCLGLIRAIEHFDASRGRAFSSLAVPYIRGEIQHYLRDRGTPIRLPCRWLALRQQAVTATQQLQQSLARPPSEAEVAAQLGITLAEWQEIELALQNREPLSLEAPASSEEGEASCLAERIPDPQYCSFELAQADRLWLQQSLAQLEARTRQVPEFVFLQDLTQKETARQLGISAITVSRQIKKGLQMLQAGAPEG